MKFKVENYVNKVADLLILNKKNNTSLNLYDLTYKNKSGKYLMSLEFRLRSNLWNYDTFPNLTNFDNIKQIWDKF